MLSLLPYVIEYKSDCLELFDSNLELFFDQSERDDFEKFLDKPNCEYFVFKLDAKVVACGGYYVSSENFGSLCWGMVTKGLHKKGIGLEMTTLRLRKMSESKVKKVFMDTSSYSVGFYEKLGFRVTKRIKNGYGEGLDQINLELIL